MRCKDDLTFVDEVDRFATVNDQSMITEAEILQAEKENREEQKQQRLNSNFLAYWKKS